MNQANASPKAVTRPAPQDEGIAGLRRLEASERSWARVAATQGEILVDSGRADAGIK
jgi:hypothetical protein